MSITIEEIGRRFRSESTVNLLRILTIALYIASLALILSIFSPVIWNPQLQGAATTNVRFPLPTLFYYLVLLLGQIFTNAVIMIYWGIYLMFYGLHTFFSFYSILLGVPLSPYAAALPPNLISISVPADELFVAFYFSLFPLSIIASVISLLYFLINCDSKNSFTAFIYMILPMFLAIFTPTIGMIMTYLPIIFSFLPLSGILSIFGGSAYIEISLLCAIFIIIFIWKIKTAISKRKKKWVRNILIVIFALVFFNSFLNGTNLVAIGTDLESFTQLFNPIVNNLGLFFGNLNLLTFFGNPVMIAVLVALFFLEVSFQTSYVYEVFLPSALRGKRLEEQMKELERLATKKEEEKKELTPKEEGETESQSFTVRKYFSSEAFDYMREMIEKRKKADRREEERKKASKKKKEKMKEQEEEEVLDLARVQQLFSYVEERYRQDPMARATLTASAATPSKRKVLISAGKSTLYRIIILIGLTFFIMNVANLFYLISPPDIVYRIEILTAEMIIILLLPIALIFPLIGSIIKMQRRPKIYRRPKKPAKKKKRAKIKKPAKIKKHAKRSKRMKPPAEITR